MGLVIPLCDPCWHERHRGRAPRRLNIDDPLWSPPTQVCGICGELTLSGILVDESYNQDAYQINDWSGETKGTQP